MLGRLEDEQARRNFEAMELDSSVETVRLTSVVWRLRRDVERASLVGGATPEPRRSSSTQVAPGLSTTRGPAVPDEEIDQKQLQKERVAKARQTLKQERVRPHDCNEKLSQVSE